MAKSLGKTRDKSLGSARDKFYVTAAIPYVNAPPHIGHALEYVQGDVLARWHRLLGDDVFYLAGADENTLKLIQAAEKEGITPQQLADKYTAQFIELLKVFKVSNDSFIRTTDKNNHHPGAKAIWQKLSEAGYIYKGKYEGLYCVDCEQFYKEKEIVDGKCPIHGTALEQRSEENYLFKLSAFTKQIEQVLTDGTYSVEPAISRNEVLSFVRQGLQDISFSRPAERLRMGVPVPGDDDHTMYVWVDALANYVTGIGYGRDDAKFAKWWPADVHVIGKDIVRFHAVYWPAMLLGAGLPLPKKLYVHGFFTVEGAKMSKSKGNVIDPFELVEKHGVDPVRYYLLAAMPLGGDGDYSEHHFREIYNAELANDLGNLVSRVTALVSQQEGGQVPKGTADRALAEHVAQTHHELANLLGDFAIAQATQKLHQLVSTANKFIDAKQPYKQQGQALADSLYTLVQLLGHLSLLYWPFIPDSAEKLQQQLGLKAMGWDKQSLLKWEKVPPDRKVSKGKPLFPKHA